MLTHLSLFSGIGGLDIAAELAGFTTVGQCEWADYPTKVLEKHWPDVPRWRDIWTLTGESFYARTGLRTVDVISGGFPCQPFSVAGKQKGRGDDRYLWPEMLRVIRELAPSWIIGENVPGILRLAAANVVQDLEHEAYNVVVFDYEAASVGAPHRRERVFFVAHAKGQQSGRMQQRELGQNVGSGNKDVAYADGQGSQGSKQCGPSDAGERAQEPCQPVGECSETVSDTDSARFQETRPEQQATGTIEYMPIADTQSIRLQGERPCGEQICGTRSAKGEPKGRGNVRNADGINASKEREICEVGKSEPSRDCEGRGRPAEPGLGGVADGLSRWLDEPEGVPRVIKGMPDRANRLKCLGNAVVPQQAYPIFKAIAELLKAGK